MQNHYFSKYLSNRIEKQVIRLKRINNFKDKDEVFPLLVRLIKIRKTFNLESYSLNAGHKQGLTFLNCPALCW